MAKVFLAFSHTKRSLLCFCLLVSDLSAYLVPVLRQLSRQIHASSEQAQLISCNCPQSLSWWGQWEGVLRYGLRRPQNQKIIHICQICGDKAHKCWEVSLFRTSFCVWKSRDYHLDDRSRLKVPLWFPEAFLEAFCGHNFIFLKAGSADSGKWFWHCFWSSY